VVVTPDGGIIQATTLSRQSASDLKGFGTRAWIRGLLEDPSDPKYFGATPALKGMKSWKEGSKLAGEQLDRVADFVAELADVGEDESFIAWYERRYDGDLDGHPGHDLFVEDCGKCHLLGPLDMSITEGGFMEAPNLFGYGSTAWLRRMIEAPEADELYGYLDDEHRMPAFEGRLSENDLTTLIRFLQGDYVPMGPAAGPEIVTVSGAPADAGPAEGD
jgi:ubiquinol-cytochrome c reductase cytochrome b subunit